MIGTHPVGGMASLQCKQLLLHRHGEAKKPRAIVDPPRSEGAAEDYPALPCFACSLAAITPLPLSSLRFGLSILLLQGAFLQFIPSSERHYDSVGLFSCTVEGVRIGDNQVRRE